MKAFLSHGIPNIREYAYTKIINSFSFTLKQTLRHIVSIESHTKDKTPFAICIFKLRRADRKEKQMDMSNADEENMKVILLLERRSQLHCFLILWKERTMNSNIVFYFTTDQNIT